METKTTSKGQITIPSNVRKELGIKDGTVLHVDVNEARQIILTPVTREFVRSLRGKYKGKGLMKAWMNKRNKSFIATKADLSLGDKRHQLLQMG